MEQGEKLSRVILHSIVIIILSLGEAEARLNTRNISNFSPYRKENTARVHYRDQLIAVYTENHTKP
jgi:hypothetical protein